MRTSRLLFIAFTVAGSIVTAAGVAKADPVLYGLSQNDTNPPVLYQINTATGFAGTPLPVTGVTNTNDVVGLGALTPASTTLYAINLQTTFSALTQFTFGSIDTGSGAYTPLVGLQARSFSGLTSNAANTAFYTIDNTNHVLDTINASGISPGPAAVSTALALLPTVTFSGLAFDGTNTIYAVGNSDLYQINLTTGAVTDEGALTVVGGDADMSTPPDAPIFGLTFGTGALSGDLLLNAGDLGAANITGLGDHELYTVNGSNGNLTEIGSNTTDTPDDGNGIGAIAFATPVPEPSTIALAGLTIPALGWVVLKRRKATSLVPAPVA